MESGGKQSGTEIPERFERQYSLAYRGHIRIRNDTDAIAADLAKYHLVLFGDRAATAGSRSSMESCPPLRWTKDNMTLGARRFPSAGSVPALI
jgi:hypothetical protein